MGDLPPLAPVPPATLRSALVLEDWDACVDAWIFLVRALVKAPQKQFTTAVLKDESSCVFLTTFYHELASSVVPSLQTGPRAGILQKLCFLLTRRFLLEVSTPPAELLDWRFLGDLCCCYPSSLALRKLLSDIWEKHQMTVVSSLHKAKTLVIMHFSFGDPSRAQANFSDIRLLTILASVSPQCGQVLMTGSDFLDSLRDAYQAQEKAELRKIFVASTYVGLTSLLKEPSPNLSLFLDHLFSLKAAAGVGNAKAKKEPTLLSDLICSSDILTRLERYLSAYPQKRGLDLISSLRSYQSEFRSLHRRYQKHKRKSDKGKERVSDIPEARELYAHKLSLVTQVQDVFPDLGSGYIVRLLDFYSNSPETVISRLLDSTLSPELASLNRSEQFPFIQSVTHHSTASLDVHLPIRSPVEQPLTRRNIFDADIDIAELAQSDDPHTRGRLHVGRANPDATADTMLADRSQQASKKAAILSALAAFDADDDEYDDTYDQADVGGTVDSAVPSSADAEADASAKLRSEAAEESEMVLFRAYKSDPALFGREAATRRAQARAQLKRETGMTDEAIEGWALMLTRDPKRIAKLEDKLVLFAGGSRPARGGSLQPHIPSTSYRKSSFEMEDSQREETAPHQTLAHGSRGGRSKGRGRGARRDGGISSGGTSAGPSNAASRQRKEENKAAVANHNRRQQRAKKMARGGGLPG